MSGIAAMTRNIATCIAIGAALLPEYASADQPTVIHRIGVLILPVPSWEDGLREGLRELGYIEGTNIIIDWRRSTGTGEELRALAADLAKSKVELIVTSSTPPARAALQATTLPVVFLAGDPVATGLASSLTKPGGNATGVSTVTTEMTPKRLEFLQTLAPKIQRILYLENPANPTRERLLHEAKMAAKTLGLQIETLGARDARELDAALPAIARTHADAILVAADPLFLSNKAKVTRAVRDSKLPAIFPWKEYHEDGALMSYGSSLNWSARRQAVYVDKILKGAKPGELPIEQASKYELVIDLRVARELGIKVPQELLQRADEVIR